MIKALMARLYQKYRTIPFPKGRPPALPERFRGLPSVKINMCADGCKTCIEICPTGAILQNHGLQIDLGKCLFCRDCEEACPSGAIRYGNDYRLAVRRREDLTLYAGREELKLAEEFDKRMKSILGRSLQLRQVSAGGCGACEADVNVLNTVGWDLGRFGIQFVASPRHADGILVTGPVTKNMELALRKTYEAVPSPKIIIAVGACAISGGPYIGREEVSDGMIADIPVDLFIPGCPPHPLTTLDGLLRLTGKIRERAKR
jgi:Ni,Fe-hydrogenase III small subunit/ferredoxin